MRPWLRHTAKDLDGVIVAVEKVYEQKQLTLDEHKMLTEVQLIAKRIVRKHNQGHYRRDGSHEASHETAEWMRRMKLIASAIADPIWLKLYHA